MRTEPFDGTGIGSWRHIESSGEPINGTTHRSVNTIPICMQMDSNVNDSSSLS